LSSKTNIYIFLSVFKEQTTRTNFIITRFIQLTRFINIPLSTANV